MNLKSSISRKPLHKLNERYRRKIVLEVKRNSQQSIHLSANINSEENNSNVLIQDIPSVTHQLEFTSHDDFDNHEVDDELLSSFSYSSDDSNVPLFFENTSNELSFRQQLASCFVDNNLTHVQGNDILALLCTHKCFLNFPKDIRTLISTPRRRVVVSKVEPGEYVHFDLKKSIVQIISKFSFATSMNELELDLHTDGCSLDKSGSVHCWPIQCRIANIQGTKPIVIGFYKGAQKPNNPNLFFDKLVTDIRSIMSSRGIDFHGKKIPVRLRCFIADAPARAFILNHFSHTSSRPCSKCKIDGVRCKGRYVFHTVNDSLRTDDEYIRRVDEDHHKIGTSPLVMLPLGMVSQVPFEYMHLVCLGVMKKLLSAWVHGKYSYNSKLRGRSIFIASKRLNHLRDYCPSEFARRPRPLDACSKFKATEFRQFLLYTGIVVMHNILNESLYKHFLFLHCSIKILVRNSPSIQQLNFVELALKKFVLRCESLYGTTFNSYNVHGLLHLVTDVKRLGNLDSFSAFPYESNMSIFRKYLRKPASPLAQFANRMTEIEIHGTSDDTVVESIRVSMPYNKNTSHRHFRNIQFNNILLTLEARDNCCILRDGSICITVDIIMDDNSYRLALKKFSRVESFYDIGILSSTLGIYKCSGLCNDIFFVNPNKVDAKCYRMPLFTCTSTYISDSDEEEKDGETDQYIIAVIAHTE